MPHTRFVRSFVHVLVSIFTFCCVHFLVRPIYESICAIANFMPLNMHILYVITLNATLEWYL